MSFGTKLKELREKKGLSQIEFAKLTNLTRSAISMYELGKREPNLNTLIKFAKFFNVDINTLLEYDNTISKDDTNLNKEKKLFEMYRQLPEDVKNKIAMRIEIAYEDMLEETKTKSNMKEIS